MSWVKDVDTTQEFWRKWALERLQGRRGIKRRLEEENTFIFKLTEAVDAKYSRFLSVWRHTESMYGKDSVHRESNFNHTLNQVLEEILDEEGWW